eukprot:342145-Chlamydomonas_euryale.AAC.1
MSTNPADAPNELVISAEFHGLSTAATAGCNFESLPTGNTMVLARKANTSQQRAGKTPISRVSSGCRKDIGSDVTALLDSSACKYAPRNTPGEGANGCRPVLSHTNAS